MPIYQYKCPECGEELEKLQKLTDAPPSCQKGHGAMQKQFSTPAFTFKNGKGTSGGHTMRMPNQVKK